MSELRWDPLQDTWTVFSPERARRPQDYLLTRQEDTNVTCPFCYGREDKTPPEVYAVRPQSGQANGPQWQVRVVPNKFPILGIEGQLQRQGVGLYDRLSGIGAHEVIIETPQHRCHPGDIGSANWEMTLKAFQSRLRDLRRDHRFRYLQIYQNHGQEAGAPIPHAHSQLLAVPVVPPLIKRRLQVCREHFQRKERCLVCDLIQQEQHGGKRCVYDDGQFLVCLPYAAPYPFQLRIMPLQHQHDFAQISAEQVQALAQTLVKTLQALRHTLRDPAFQMVLYTAPPPHPRPGRPDYWSSLSQDYHWHLEIIPLLRPPVGFEWATGLYINPTPPEQAASFLQECPSLQ